MRRVHANLDCPHDDAKILELRRLHDNGDSEGVLREVARLRNSQSVTVFQQTIIDIHCVGALFMTGQLGVEDFIREVEIFVARASEQDYLAAADMSMWRVQRVAESGHAALARELLGDFFELIPRSPATEIYRDTAQALLALTEGQPDVARTLLITARRRCDQKRQPCIYEFIVLTLAEIFMKAGNEMEARAMLRGANIPASIVEHKLSMMK